jgi:hypothetical protein
MACPSSSVPPVTNNISDDDLDFTAHVLVGVWINRLGPPPAVDPLAFRNWLYQNMLADGTDVYGSTPEEAMEEADACFADCIAMDLGSMRIEPGKLN